MLYYKIIKLANGPVDFLSSVRHTAQDMLTLWRFQFKSDFDRVFLYIFHTIYLVDIAIVYEPFLVVVLLAAFYNWVVFNVSF